MWVSVCVFISMHFATCVQWTLNIHFHCAIKQYKIILQMIIFSRPSCTHTHEHLDIPGALDCKSGIINANNILAACIHHKMGHANKTITNEMKWLYYRTIYKVGIPWCVCVCVSCENCIAILKDESLAWWMWHRKKKLWSALVRGWITFFEYNKCQRV